MTRANLGSARDGSSDNRDGDGFAGLPNGRRWRIALYVVLAVLAAWLVPALFGPPRGEDLAYSTFLQQVEEGRVASVVIGPDGRINGERPDGSPITTVAPTAVDDTQLLEMLRDADVQVDARPPSDAGWAILLLYLLPFLLIAGFWWWRLRQMGGGGGALGPFANIGRSKAKAITEQRPDVGFGDIAGYEGVKQEIREVVDYLREPERYAALGARGPGGLAVAGPTLVVGS